MGKKFDEVTDHINRAKSMMKKAEAYDDVDPQQANLALKETIVELLQALEKLCTVEVNPPKEDED